MSQYKIGTNSININKETGNVHIDGQFAGYFQKGQIKQGIYIAVLQYDEDRKAEDGFKEFTAQHEAEQWIVSETLKKLSNDRLQQLIVQSGDRINAPCLHNPPRQPHYIEEVR